MVGEARREYISTVLPTDASSMPLKSCISQHKCSKGKGCVKGWPGPDTVYVRLCYGGDSMHTYMV